jgi:glucokinase
MTSETRLIGLDIGGTKSAALLGDARGNVLAREQFPTSGPDETVEKLFAIAKRLIDGRAIGGCGISCGGPLSSRLGQILSPPNLPGWDRIPIVARCVETFGTPTLLENDANASALAEWEWGLHRKVDNLIYLTCGTGQGAGLILDRRLYRGREDGAGEIGHIRLAPDGPVGFGKAGSVEGLTSGPGLARLAKLRIDRPAPPEGKEWTSPQIGAAALAGDAFALSIVEELATHLGHACAILIDMLNPQRISLGSMALRLGDVFLKPVRAAAKAESLPVSFEACTIAPAALGDRIQDCAALAAARLASEFHT